MYFRRCPHLRYTNEVTEKPVWHIKKQRKKACNTEHNTKLRPFTEVHQYIPKFIYPRMDRYKTCAIIYSTRTHLHQFILLQHLCLFT